MYSDRDLTNLNKSLRAHDGMVIRVRVLTVLTEVSLRFTGLKTTERLLSVFAKNVPPPAYNEAMVVLDRYSTIFNQVKQMPFFKGRCLSQSLVMRLLLRRKGISAELRIGVNQRTGRFDAHAWLEQGGIPLNDHPSAIADYFVLPESKLNTLLKFK